LARIARERRARPLVSRFELAVAVAAPTRVRLGPALGGHRVVFVARAEQRVVAVADAIHPQHERIILGRQPDDSIYVLLFVVRQIVVEGVWRKIGCELELRNATYVLEIVARQLLTISEHIVREVAVEILERIAGRAARVLVRTGVRNLFVRLAEPRPSRR